LVVSQSQYVDVLYRASGENFVIPHNSYIVQQVLMQLTLAPVYAQILLINSLCLQYYGIHSFVDYNTNSILDFIL